MAPVPPQPERPSETRPARGRWVFGSVHPCRYLSGAAGVGWVAISVVVVARPPVGVSALGWRVAFALSPLIGLATIVSVLLASCVRLTPLGINRARPRRQAIPWAAVRGLRLTATHDAFCLVPGLPAPVIRADRLFPEVITSGGETIELTEIGSRLSERGLEHVRRRVETVAAYAALSVPVCDRLEDYRALARTVGARRRVDRS